MDPGQRFRNSTTKRSEFFGKLKPCCLEIVKALRRGSSSERDAASTAGSLTAITEQLHGILVDQVGYDSPVLDAGMADYVFFPLLPIFQHIGDYPARVVENATKCLSVLIQHGWKTSISKENAHEFLILLTSVVTGGADPGSRPGAKPEWPEETVVEGYKALSALMRAAGASSGRVSPLVTTNAIPALAHTVTVLLEGVTDSIIVGVQLEALGAVEALYTTVKDQEALAAFLPGTVSSLVRAVSAPGSQKAPKRVVIRTLEVLYAVLVNALGDLQTRHLHLLTKDTKLSSEGPKSDIASTTRPKLDASWLRATAAQVKVALASVLKLRNHESEDVQGAVRQLCLGLLDECHMSLADSASILVESAIVTAEDEDHTTTKDGEAGFQALGSLDVGLRGLGPQTTLADLAILYPELADVAKETAYSWANSLSRSMQASDEGIKRHAIRNLQKAIAILEVLRVDSTTLENTLSSALRDSVMSLALASASPRAAVNDADTDDILETGVSAIVPQEFQSAEEQSYKPVLLGLGSQKVTRDALLGLLAHIGSSSQQVRLASEMLYFVRDSDGLEQVAAFWLSFELVKASFSRSADIDSLLDLGAFGDGDGDGPEAVLEDLLSFSVGRLASHSDTVDNGDWRLGAVAMEITAFAASRVKEAFRPELIDVLYPIATYLGSPQAELRSHAITTLNSLAVSCGYTSVSELIIDNVDYMLNSVSLRLNTFDISPASTKVLTMMIRLAGPRLVPYLDDAVAAIFAALDNYHGYPLFVESLFSVLGEVVQQSVKSDTLLLESVPSEAGPSRNRKRRGAASTTGDLLDILDERAKRRKTDDTEHIRSRPKHTKQPWKSEADELLRKREAGDMAENEGEEGTEAKADDKVTSPEDAKTPTYALLARITTLTQHYLTSPTPTLRKALLDLLATVAPALAPDENAFLPLVNSVWPVMITRLYDGEPYVVTAACAAIGSLCASAGDFLASRIKAEWHASLRRWCVRVKAEAASKSGRAGVGSRESGVNTVKTSSLLQIRGRPSGHSSIAASGSSTGVLLPIRSAVGDVEKVSELLQLSSGHGSAVAEPSPSFTAGLGRFAQAVQIWEAVAGLLTDIVTYVKLDDEIYDQILDLLLATPPSAKTAAGRPVRLLPAALEQKAREALEVVNADAVWLAQLGAGQLEDSSWVVVKPPELEGVRFASLTGVETRAGESTLVDT
ncbi:heat repeat protein [Grosmannia clavigera kw1407]|uniref:Heat repeat protein n=1 Tax=Grosmannia clavigera (strain kw1407 / UAMH 11150) TaxID=655863 RepID=F0XC52_GROCL|nr:heat repeat protein [Grosmannia clavigera kw1407]EFX03985.1 heat repeat protein [Grosmannia clavigera kw1407]